MFGDLNIPDDSGNTARVVNECFNAGYSVVAITHTVSGVICNDDVCSVQPVSVHRSQNAAPHSINATFEQKSRLNIVLGDQTQLHSIVTATHVLRSYDLVSIQPTSEKMMAAVCKTLEPDIITLNLSSRLPFHMKHVMFRQAMARGIVFELCYSDAFAGSPVARRHFINNATALLRITKGRNTIVSSRAKQHMHVRGPYDIVNLCVMLGAANDMAKRFLTEFVEYALLRGETRMHTYKAVVSSRSSAGGGGDSGGGGGGGGGDSDGDSVVDVVGDGAVPGHKRKRKLA